MAFRTYRLRPAYQGIPVAGLFHNGRGEEFELSELLSQNEGEITTGDITIQGVLENLHGPQGALFDVYNIGSDNELTLIGPTVQTEADGNPPITVQGVGAPLAGIPPAQHDVAQSEYNSFTVEELKATLDDRKLQYPAKATKAELILAIESSDRQIQEDSFNARQQ